MDDLLEVAPHIQLFNEVHTEFYTNKALSCEMDLECEALYFLLFKDIRQHSSVYFDTIFNMNDIYSERAVSILGALANILKHKDKGPECLQVLKLQGQVLRKYQELSHPPTNNNTTTPTRRRGRVQRAQIQCCRQLTYQWNDLQIEVNAQWGNRDTAVQAFRDACSYEMEEKYSFQQQKWLVVLFSVTGPAYENLTREQLAELSDDSLWQALLHSCRPNTTQTSSSGPTFEVDLRKCHGCERMEHVRGEFEECPKCLKVFYCSEECQDRHKKVHKKQCSKSSTGKRTSPKSVLKFGLSLIP